MNTFLEKFLDILLLVFGLVVLVGVSTGEFEFEYGPVGYLAAFACIGFGLHRMFRMRSGAKTARKLLEDPKVASFYNHTRNAWSEGDLAYMDKRYRKEGRRSYSNFIKKYRPIEGGALAVLLQEFPPTEDEYLVDSGDIGAEKGWFVLTNTRLIQKDGASGAFKEVRLGEVEDVKVKGAWKKSIHFRLKSGDVVGFEKVTSCPAETDMAKVMAHVAAEALTAGHGAVQPAG